VTATFTAEPVQEVLDFWMAELDIPASVEFAPYNQVFQQLLDPASLLGQNRRGANIVLVRVEDWYRLTAGTMDGRQLEEHLTKNAADLIDAVQAATARSSIPVLVALCPDSPAARAARTGSYRIADQIVAGLQGAPGLCLIGTDDFRAYPVDDYFDPRRDQLGHIPYTPLFYTALGTVLARKIHALHSPPHKVIALDCDNTLWKGVVGEEGVEGISIPPPFLRLQQVMTELSGNGFLLCLCSKNEESDVLEVFEGRSDMVLRHDQLVSWRINWQPKSQNIRALAQELKLGLDSFIFLDDNPVECAEVRADCPEVLTLRLPVDGDVEAFLEHVWVFDRPRVTAEDRERIAMYRQEAERARFQQEAMTIEEFLAGLDLRITISEPAPDQVARVAQLTQRTNQFNFSTVRRNESEVQRLAQSGLECRVVEVSDRFGNYGLVGVMIVSGRGEVLEIDTFLLSCRVLGRGVEHRMLRELAEIAQQRGLCVLSATVLFTSKNLPARQFLEHAAADFGQDLDGGRRYRIPADRAASLTYAPEAPRTEVDRPTGTIAGEPVAETVASLAVGGDKSHRFERIATELRSPDQVLKALQSRSRKQRARSTGDRPFVTPRTAIETALADVWAESLRTEPVGTLDNFFDLGGSSLLAVDLFAQIDRRFGKRLPLTSLIEAPTIELLARRIAGTASGDSLVLIREGGDRPPLFWVHDGDGETMLYRNLALRLDAGHTVYGLQPHSQPNIPMVHTRIREMAAYHIGKIRSVQPHGPYLLGGMCAGGVIAFEIARQLQDQGEKVSMVALLDAADPATPLKKWRSTQQRLHRFRGVFDGNGAQRFERRVISALGKVVRKVRNLTAYLAGEWFRTSRDELRMKLFRAYMDRGRTLPRALRQLPVRTVYLFAEKDHRPEGRFDGELALFRATRGEGPDEPYIDRYDDPLLGWGCRATEGVRSFDIPGGHSSMLQEPQVGTLAAELQAYIDEALADEPPLPCPAVIANGTARIMSLTRQADVPQLPGR